MAKDSKKAARDKLNFGIKCEKRIERAKRKARSELKKPRHWWRHHYARDGYYCEVQRWKKLDNLTRINSYKVSLEEFRSKYEIPNLPVVIQGGLEEWDLAFWTFSNFLKIFSEIKFKCGEDDEGYSVKLKYKYYHNYMNNQNDDSPLYIFDGNFSGEKNILTEHYKPLNYFQDDYFKYAGEKHRPPYKWIVIGPERSGSNIHIDPLGTSAWNTLIHGHKRWVLFPPSTPKKLIKPSFLKESEAICWFDKVYPLCRSDSWEGPPPIEVVQCPGETIFVPSGWWHVVLNMDKTLAVTQNFVSRVNLNLVWKLTVKGRPKFSKYWFYKVTHENPQLALKMKEANFIEKELNFPEDSSSESSSSTSDFSDFPQEFQDTILSQRGSHRNYSDLKKRSRCTIDRNYKNKKRP